MTDEVRTPIAYHVRVLDGRLQVSILLDNGQVVVRGKPLDAFEVDMRSGVTVYSWAPDGQSLPDRMFDRVAKRVAP